MPPKLIGPYRIEGALGKGGIGTVYRAKDRRDGRPVALKMLSTGPALEPNAARRLAVEFEALSDLDHPNVVRVLDVGVHEGYPYLAMELVDGLDLRAWLSIDPDHDGALSRHERAALRRQAARLHAEGDDSVPWFSQSSDEASAALLHGGDDPSAPSWDSFELDAAQGEGPLAAGEAARGLEQIAALAWQADEPDTEERIGVVDIDALVPIVHSESGAYAIGRRRIAIDLGDLNRPSRVARLRDAAIQLCGALAYIHGRGLVHRDVKPANVMVDETHRVRLMDFGLAKFLARAEREVNVSGRIVGTYRYVAPELLRQEPLDGRADLYSLGVTLFELCCGQPPFDANSPNELWSKVLETEPPPLQILNPGVDPQLAAIAYRLLRKDPEERYQTAEEVAEALSEF